MTKLLLLSIAFLPNFLFAVTASNWWLDRPKRDDALEDPELDQFGIFVGTVLADNNDTLPAIIVSGISAVTSAEIGSNWAKRKLCPGLTEKLTQCLVIHDCQIDGDLAYLKVPLMVSFSKEIQALVNKGAIRGTFCVAVCHLHKILKVKYLPGSNEVECSRCNFLDALFCDFQMVGALGKSNTGKFPILRYTTLQENSLQRIGDDQSTKVWETFRRHRTNSKISISTSWSPSNGIIVAALLLIML